MITVVLVNDYSEVRIFHYETDSEEEAARFLEADWAAGKVSFEITTEPDLFDPEWAHDAIDHELNDLIPQYENGVRTMHFYLSVGMCDRDDRQAWAYFVHSTHKKGEAPEG